MAYLLGFAIANNLLNLLLRMIRCVFTVARRVFDTPANRFRAKEDGKEYVLLYHFLIQIFFYFIDIPHKLCAQRIRERK